MKWQAWGRILQIDPDVLLTSGTIDDLPPPSPPNHIAQGREPHNKWPFPVSSQIVGLRAKRRRKELGLTVNQMCVLLNVASPKTLSNWESGAMSVHVNVEKVATWESCLRKEEGWLTREAEPDELLTDIGPSHIVISGATLSEAIEGVARYLAAPALGHDSVNSNRNAIRDRDAELFACRYGVRGPNLKTLEEIGVAWQMTRERVRQILDRMINHTSTIMFEVPAFDALQASTQLHLPVHIELLTQLVREQLGENVTIEDAMRFGAEVLGRSLVQTIPVESLPAPGALPIAIPPDLDFNFYVDGLGALRHHALAMIRSCGAAHVGTVAGLADGVTSTSIPLLVKALSCLPHFEWLDSERSWFWFGEDIPGRNILLSLARKVFSVATQRVEITTLLEALIRARSRIATNEYDRSRSLMIVPPVHVAKAIFASRPWLLTLQHDDYRPIESLSRDEVLSGTELRILRILEAQGGVATYADLSNGAQDILKVTFTLALSGSPVFYRVSRGIYAITGRPLDPVAYVRATEIFAEQQRRRALTSFNGGISLAPDEDGCYGYTMEISESMAKTMLAPLPAILVERVPIGTYQVVGLERTVDCVSRESGSTVMNRMIQACFALGYAAGDVVQIKVSPANRTIQISQYDVE